MGGTHEQCRRQCRILLEREVQIGARIVAQTGTTNVAHNADDFRGCCCLLEQLSDWILVREETLLNRLAHDHHGMTPWPIALVEDAPRDERYAEGSEKSAGRSLPPNLRWPLTRRN